MGVAGVEEEKEVGKCVGKRESSSIRCRCEYNIKKEFRDIKCGLISSGTLPVMGNECSCCVNAQNFCNS
jgi:hypothetical protein